LEVDRAFIGGAVAKGVAISGTSNSEVTLFVRGLPSLVYEDSYAPLIQALACVIEQDVDFRSAHCIQRTCVVDGHIEILSQGADESNAADSISLAVYVSPAFDDYQQAVDALTKAGPEWLQFYQASFLQERTQFVARQPSSVRITIRLMKWWRDRQDWYGSRARPSDDVIELTTIYSAAQTKPADQKEAIANVMSLLSRFRKLRVIWSNYYSKDDVLGPLLRQRPLLMDPSNPFLNHADRKVFDPTELMTLAQRPHFFQ
jgi:hypothetical protein